MAGTINLLSTFKIVASGPTIGFQFHGASAAATANTVSASLLNSTGANLIVIVIGTENTTVSLSDNKFNTWTLIRTDTTTSDYLKTYYCYSPTVGTGHSFNVTSIGGYPAIAVAGFNNVSASPLDQQNGFGTTGVNSIQPGSITPSANNYLVVTGFMTDFGSTFPTPTVSAAFTLTDAIPLSGTSVGVGMAYQIQTIASGANPTWSGFATGHAISSIVSFK